MIKKTEDGSARAVLKFCPDYMRATRGVRQPEIIIAKSAHAAYWKAAEYFKLKLVVVDVSTLAFSEQGIAKGTH